MTHRFRISPDAQTDLDQIWDYIAADDPTAATRFVDRLTERFEMLARQPLIGEVREELQARLRDFPAGNYVIYYLPVESGDVAVEIVRILHGARDIRRLF